MLKEELEQELAEMRANKAAILPHLNALEGAIISAEAFLRKYFTAVVEKVEGCVAPALEPVETPAPSAVTPAEPPAEG